MCPPPRPGCADFLQVPTSYKTTSQASKQGSWLFRLPCLSGALFLFRKHYLSLSSHLKKVTQK